jgi:hypothetical protein
MRGWTLDRIRTAVIKFVASHAADMIVHRLEAAKRTGPVIISSKLDRQAWSKPDKFTAASRFDRDVHILLFLHGAFSSTGGAFSDLRPRAGARRCWKRPKRSMTRSSATTIAHCPSIP